MTKRILEASLWVPQPPESVFPFFADAGNLDRLTPPWLNFRILSPTPVEMRQGTLIDYRLRIHGLPIRWRSEISLWQPPYAFVDEQVMGPYRSWHHLHTFLPEDGGTRLGDRVAFRIPGGPIEPLLFRTLVGRDLKRIFRFRMEVLSELFGAPLEGGSVQLQVA